MADPSDDVRVSTLELFFDLVFVFTITQLTAVLLAHPTAEGLLRVSVMLVVIWWMYGGYAWLTNVLAPDRLAYQLLLLGGMAGFLILSLAVPHAFGDGGLAFGVGYLAVVLIHAGLFTRSRAGSSAAAILRVAPLNVAAALLMVLAGLLDGPVRAAMWAVVVAVILLPSLRRPDARFEVTPSHFVERHALVVIVALGESVVAVGVGASSQRLTASLIIVTILGLGLTACLWWSYFGASEDERALEAMSAAPRHERPVLALRAFYHWHLPILLGIVATASAVQRAVGHPFSTLSPARSLALGGGIGLFLLGEMLFRRTLALGPNLWRAISAVLALATIPAGTQLAAMAQLGLLVCVLSGGFVMEAVTGDGLKDPKVSRASAPG